LLITYIISQYLQSGKDGLDFHDSGGDDVLFDQSGGHTITFTNFPDSAVDDDDSGDKSQVCEKYHVYI
jgi:hypothetical protein